MNPKREQPLVSDRWLTIEETRIVSDLRIMHAKVDELHQLVDALKKRHSELDIVKYADQPILTEDLRKIDEIYLWFVKLWKRTSLSATRNRELSHSHRLAVPIPEPCGST